MDPKEHVINQSDMLFCRNGIKSVTMDDIARQLGVSKKTIYHQFSDKNEIVVELMRAKMENQVILMETCINNSKNAVHEVFLAVTQMGELLSNINPVLFHDLQKYHPQAWQYYVTFREKKLFGMINTNLKRGIAEGFYRQEINSEILTWMRIGQIDTVFSQTVYPDHFNISALMTEITEHFLYGVCSAAGFKLIGEYNTTQQELKDTI